MNFISPCAWLIILHNIRLFGKYILFIKQFTYIINIYQHYEVAKIRNIR